MELFEEIRREQEFGVGTIQGVSRKLGVHRRMVRQALGGLLVIAAWLGASAHSSAWLFLLLRPNSRSDPAQHSRNWPSWFSIE